MSTEAPILCCVVCGDRIGVYEPFLDADADPGDAPRSWTQLARHGIDARSVRALHVDCRPASG